MKTRFLIASAALMFVSAGSLRAAWQPGLLGGYAYRSSNTHDMTVEPANTNVWPCTSAATNNTVGGTGLWANNRCWIYWGQIYLPAGNWSIASFNDDTCYIYVDDVLIHNQPSYAAKYTPNALGVAEAGWRDVVVRMGNGSGGAGPVAPTLSNMGGAFGLTDMANPPQTLSSDYTFPDGTGEIRFRHDDGLGFDQITVAGLPGEYGTPTPNYGVTNNLVADTQYLFTCPAVWTNDEQTVAAVCRGYTLALTNGTTVSGTALSTNITYSAETANATLTWLWDVQYKVTATAGAGGTVSPVSQWVAHGAAATVTATPADESRCFYKWEGDVPEANARENPLTLAADQARSVTALFGRRYHVAAGGADVNGGTSWEDALATLNVAAAKVADGDEIALGTGVFNVSNVVSVTRDVKIHGRGWDSTFITATNLPSKVRVFSINNIRAELCGFTVSNVVFRDGYYHYGHGVYLTSGFVHDCRFVKMSQINSFYTQGQGIYMAGAGAWASNCVINTGSADGLFVVNGRAMDVEVFGCGGGNKTGAQLSVQGGTLERAKVTGGSTLGLYISSGVAKNVLVHSIAVSGAGPAGVQVSGGSLLHATVSGCSAATAIDARTGLYQDNGVVSNGIFHGNGALGSAKVTKGTFGNNLTDSNVGYGTGNLVADPQFADAAGRDYRLQLGSAAIDAATPLAAVTDDLDGNARLQGSAPDLGAYEHIPGTGALAAGIYSPAVDYAAGASPVFTAVVEGGDLEGLTYAWYVDGSETAAGDGHTFTLSGAEPGRHAVRLVVSQPGTEPVEVVLADAVNLHPSEVYVDHAGSNTYPYERPGKAAHQLDAAVAALWSSAPYTDTVHVAEGTFGISKTVVLNKPVRVLGAGADHTEITGAGAGCRVFALGHAGAVVRDLTIANVSLDQSGLLVTMSAGMVAGCRMTNGVIPFSYAPYGAAVSMSGGTVTNCVIAHCQNNGAYGDGTAVNASGGTVMDTVVEFCKGKYALFTSGAATFQRCTVRNGTCPAIRATGAALFDACRVYGNRAGSPMCHLANSGATMKNALVYCNTNSSTGTAGMRLENGRVLHCTLAGNFTQTDSLRNSGINMTAGAAINNVIHGNGADGLGGCYVTGGTFATNVIDNTVERGVGCYLADPKFVDARDHDYRPALGSPCVDAAAPLADVAGDIEGVARPQGGAPDIGCHEQQFGGTMLILR